MDSEIWAAIIAALVGLVAAWWARTTSRVELRAQREHLTSGFAHELETLRRQQQSALEQVLLESKSEYELEILRRRLDAYQRLMSILKPLSLDGRAAPDDEGAERLAYAITDWYAGDGGLLLSPEARNSLLALRRALLQREPGVAAQLKSAYPPRADASRLRTQLAKDVMTRRRPYENAEPHEREAHPDE